MPLPRTPPIHIPTPKARATSPASTAEFPVPDELGELLPSLSQSLDNDGFFETCLSTRGRCELVELEWSAHPAAGLVNHLRTHSAPVSTHYTLSEGDLEAAIAYGCHGSAAKGAAFARTELAEQVWYGHVVVFPLSKVRDLADLWISPVGLIPQEGRQPRLIYDFTFGGLNDAVRKEAPAEAIQFGGAFRRLIHNIVTADPAFGPVFLSKIDMSDAYMRVWVRPEDVLKLAFVVPPHADDTETLIGFHLSLPMGYVESAQYFCTTTETVADLANSNWAKAAMPPPPIYSTTTPIHLPPIPTAALASLPSASRRKCQHYV